MAAALAYLVGALSALEIQRLFGRLSGRDWLLTGLASLAYAAALLLLARAWLFRASPDRDVPLAAGLAIYGPAVIAKYLPGSVFQYASRQFLGATRGLSQIEMAKASILEVVLHVAAALGVALMLFQLPMPAALGVLFVSGLAVSFLGRGPLAKSAGLQFAFFSAFAAIVMTLAALVFQAEDAAQLTALFMVAWVAGFLVPVAPGGIGVREAVLIALAVPGESAASVALFAVLTRVMTIVGDAVFGLLAYLVAAVTRENRHAS